MYYTGRGEWTEEGVGRTHQNIFSLFTALLTAPGEWQKSVIALGHLDAFALDVYPAFHQVVRSEGTR